ncbi:MAG: PQQ-binding-like beta-propeller repeat protein [Planctomycetales bacterium]|nr:PQQ-binding-like beta-propeller repeat protein [Planctomycetales bacterium]
MACLFGAVLTWSCGDAAANDWAYWRGPEQDGICREQGLVDDWSLADKKNVVWTSDVGGRAAPVILNGRVYLNCRTDDDVNDPETKVHAREQVICWDLKTGKELWRDVFNVFQTDIAAPRVGWAAMTGDPETGNVYVHSVSGLFRCYDKDGKQLWEHSLFEDMGKIAGYGGRTVTPIIDENRVIVSYFGLSWGKYSKPPPQQTFYAYDKKSGELLWRAGVGGRPLDTIYSNPIVRVINGQRMLITGGADGGCHAVNARTGQPIWSFMMSKRGLNASPVTDGDHVFISHGEDNIDTVEFGRIQCIDATGTGDVTSSKSVWRVDGVKAGYTGLLLKDGILYVVADTGNLHAYDSKTGKELWTHNLGTVGKGSPVWADGKIYVMEVNGNIHILKPSREGCETLSHVELSSRVGEGMDEIYASPAIADGYIVFVTRDRTICIGGNEVTTAPIPPLPSEGAAENKPAFLQLSPAEVILNAGEKVEYQLNVYDDHGRLIETVAPKELQAEASLAGAKVEGNTVSFGADAANQDGFVTAKLGELTAEAGIRVAAPLPWKFDFEGFKGTRVPPIWVNAFLKLKPTEEPGNTYVQNTAERGRPGTQVWFGPSNMSGYTVQADIRLREEKRRLPSAGLTAQRYNLIIKGNVGKLAIQSWAPHLRMAKEIRFRADADVWYTTKLRVDIEDGKAIVRGKVWERGKEEPEAWTIEAVDPHPNMTGSPGLYTYALAPSDFDNILVTKE